MEITTHFKQQIPLHTPEWEAESVPIHSYSRPADAFFGGLMDALVNQHGWTVGAAIEFCASRSVRHNFDGYLDAVIRNVGRRFAGNEAQCWSEDCHQWAKENGREDPPQVLQRDSLQRMTDAILGSS